MSYLTRILLAVVALTSSAVAVHAGSFQVEPTRLDLATRGVPIELTLTNRGQATASFEAKVFAWRQDARGVMQLEPTTTVVVYPTLFVIKGGQQRSLRIASTVGAKLDEQSYRVIVEELPVRRAAGDATTSAVTVRTQIGVPLFIAPVRAEVRGQITGTVRAGQLAFEINNRGTVHVKTGTIRILGTDTAGKVLLDHRENGWYVLAGGTRAYTLPLAACARIARVAIEAKTDRGAWKTIVVVPQGSCSNAT